MDKLKVNIMEFAISANRPPGLEKAEKERFMTLFSPQVKPCPFLDEVKEG
jgi:hypothetical protein